MLSVFTFINFYDPLNFDINIFYAISLALSTSNLNKSLPLILPIRSRHFSPLEKTRASLGQLAFIIVLGSPKAAYK